MPPVKPPTSYQPIASAYPSFDSSGASNNQAALGGYPAVSSISSGAVGTGYPGMPNDSGGYPAMTNFTSTSGYPSASSNLNAGGYPSMNSSGVSSSGYPSATPTTSAPSYPSMNNAVSSSGGYPGYNAFQTSSSAYGQ